MYLVYSVYSHTVISRFRIHTEYIGIHRRCIRCIFEVSEYRQLDTKYIKYTDFKIHLKMISAESNISENDFCACYNGLNFSPQIEFGK